MADKTPDIPTSAELPPAPTVRFENRSSRVPGYNEVRNLAQLVSWNNGVMALNRRTEGLDMVQIGNQVHVLSPEVAQYMLGLDTLSSNLAVKDKEPIVTRGSAIVALRNFTGGGILTEESGSEHLKLKSILNKHIGTQLNPEVLLTTLEHAFTEHFKEPMIGKKVNFEQQFDKVSLDIIMTQLTGLSPDELSNAYTAKGLNKDRVLKQFLTDFKSSATQAVLFKMGRAKAEKLRVRMANQVKVMVDIAMSHDGGSAIRSLNKEVEGQSITETAMIATIAEVIAAGRETTSAAINSILPLIFSNSELLGSVYQEIQDLDVSKIQDLNKFMKSALDTNLGRSIIEGLRLFPAISNAPLIANLDITFSTPSGGTVMIEKGTEINILLPIVNRRSNKLKNPELFDPSRFDSTITDSQTVRTILEDSMTFSGGVRKCLGETSAMYTMYYVIARFMNQYIRHNMKPTQSLPVIYSGTNHTTVTWDVQPKDEEQ